MVTNDRTMSDQDRATYARFIEWLRQSWYGVPDSDVLMPYVAARYTPEEAALLTGMPFAPKTLAELSDFSVTEGLTGFLSERGFTEDEQKFAVEFIERALG